MPDPELGMDSPGCEYQAGSIMGYGVDDPLCTYLLFSFNRLSSTYAIYVFASIKQAEQEDTFWRHMGSADLHGHIDADSVPGLQAGWLFHHSVGTGSSAGDQFIAGGTYANVEFWANSDASLQPSSQRAARSLLLHLLSTLAGRATAYARVHTHDILPGLATTQLRPPVSAFQFPDMGKYNGSPAIQRDSGGTFYTWILLAPDEEGDTVDYLYHVEIAPNAARALSDSLSAKSVFMKLSGVVQLDVSHTGIGSEQLHAWVAYVPEIYCNANIGGVYQNLFFLITLSTQSAPASCGSKLSDGVSFLGRLTLAAREFKAI
jgi:hypothetical protein